ncbi:MAG TPA: LUD domain-containing protein [Euzebyales bacterium]|nr:LUD domain-containing protein [Euzebyales bacterium]
MSARDEVLARIRAALGDTADDHVDVPRDYDRHGRAVGDIDLLDLLDERLTDYQAHVRRTPPDGVADAVAHAIADGLTQAPEAIGSPPRIVVPPGLRRDWLSVVDGDIVADDGLTVDDLDGCRGVITTAAVAIAETGTIVLDSSPDQGRRAITLVPDLHVCVVHADQIVASVPEGVARLDPTRPQTWISGPSATSDIELSRVEGVHGPRTLEIVLVRP